MAMKIKRELVNKMNVFHSKKTEVKIILSMQINISNNFIIHCIRTELLP